MSSPPPGSGPPGDAGSWSTSPRWDTPAARPAFSDVGGAPAGPGLRPMNLGDVLDGMFRIFMRHWRTFLSALGVLYLPSALLTAYGQREAPGLLELFSAPQGAALPVGPDPATLVGAFSFQILVGTLLTPLIWGVSCAIAAAAFRGERPEPWAILAETARRYGALFGATLLAYVVFLLILALPVAMVVAGAVTEAPALAVVGGLLTLLALLAGFVAWAFFMVYVPVIVVEHLGPVGALRRSAHLVRQRFWPMLGIGLLALIIASIITGVLGFPFNLGATFIGGAVGAVLLAFGTLISGVLTTPLSANALTLLYYDVRIRHEGLDLELMTRDLAADDPNQQPGASGQGTGWQ